MINNILQIIGILFEKSKHCIELCGRPLEKLNLYIFNDSPKDVFKKGKKLLK